eukprot:7598636-Pyramimonas_sp.AAC.1
MALGVRGTSRIPHRPHPTPPGTSEDTGKHLQLLGARCNWCLEPERLSGSQPGSRKRTRSRGRRAQRGLTHGEERPHTVEID